MRIADLLIPSAVRQFRLAVLDDRVSEVRGLLREDPLLLGADFTAGRGIAQAIHHFRSAPLGEVLVDKGADLTALTTLNESPLGMQVRFGDLECMRLLLERGANPNLGRMGAMPSHRMEATVELLLEYGWEIGEGDLLHDANHGHGARIKIWLKYGADANASDEQGRTPLHLLAARGTGREAIQALVEAGADLEQRDQDGNRPIDLARQAKQATAADVLLKLGAHS